MIPDKSIDEGVNSTLDIATQILVNKWVLWIICVGAVVCCLQWAWKRPAWRGAIVGLLFALVAVTLFLG